MSRWLVNRYCHVALSNREAIRAIRSKMVPAERRAFARKADRKKIYRAIIEHHAANRQLVRDFRL